MNEHVTYVHTNGSNDAWEFEKYVVIDEGDCVLRFETRDGELLGTVVAGCNDYHNENIAALNNGECPITSGWEDGAGNTVSLDGWGNEWLQAKYKEWRVISEQMIQDGHNGDIDCGNESVRIDFSNFADLGHELSFEEMYEIEQIYESR